MEEIKDVEIRMYRAGTGDCFVLKFFSDTSEIFTMMIDGGTWSGTKKELQVIVKDLKNYVGNKIDLLVITHEHKDHVYLFSACEELFTNDFDVDEVWMAWSEDDQDETVKEWKEKYGQKKRALALASERIDKGIKNQNVISQLKNGFQGEKVVNRFKNFASSLNDFKALHFSVDKKKKYKGGLKGMEVVKNQISKDNIRYCKPGNIEKISKLEGVNFYILGPPLSIDAIKDHGRTAEEGDLYDHNEILRRSDSFSAAITNTNSSDNISPFDPSYYSNRTSIKKYYNDETEAWRTIDLDWLVSGAGNLALRVNSGINNLSLAMAIEFEDSKKVMLFPGDAEFGSWKSWHQIDWEETGAKKKHLTEDLLNRTVFYKVAHHLSHNGTAKEKGLKMMKSSDLVAMATLDFKKISSNWKSTMPNRGILKDLINQTRGRLIIMNEEDLFYDFDEKVPISERIKDERKRLTDKEKSKFNASYKEHKLYKQYKLDVTKN
ncbi:hypothetical protein [Winogradskyella sp. 3972H.M.0a.05]|uniref:hypothetical protein n=1 Tax=Winogradskyella sp. 3972H.M.0a.05 TaxID=2950277 RepID=UPI00339B8906